MALRQKFFDYMTKYQPVAIVWVMLIQAAVFYLGHALINPLVGETRMLLFEGMESYGLVVPVVWGVVGLASIAFEWIGVTLNSPVITRFFAWAQVFLWAFAVYVYFASSLFILVFAVAIPQLLFWSWNLDIRYDHERVVREVRSHLKSRP